MSKHKYIKYIQNELQRINEIIDFKILHGLSYKEETRLHKELLSQIGSFKQKKQGFSFLSFLL